VVNSGIKHLNRCRTRRLTYPQGWNAEVAFYRWRYSIWNNLRIGALLPEERCIFGASIAEWSIGHVILLEQR
jgi:hypothetical protein